MNKEEQLVEAIYNARANNRGKELQCILMHPQKWDELKTEVFYNNGISISRTSSEIQFRGIDVLRTLDIKKGVIRICF